MQTRVIAGHFKEMPVDQEITVMSLQPKKNKGGSIIFEEDGVTPVMEEVPVQRTISVLQRVWIKQQRMELTAEESLQRKKDDDEHLATSIRIENIQIADTKESMKIAAANKAHHEALMSDDEAGIKERYRTKIKEIDAAKHLGELESISI